MKHSFKKFLSTRKLYEIDSSDIEWGREIQQSKDRKADDENPQASRNFSQKMKDSESLRKGDRIYSKKADKFYAVEKITSDGIYLKGRDKPVKVKVRNSGKQTDLGHRIFIPTK